MKRLTLQLIFVLIAAVLVVSACNFPLAPTPEPYDPNAINTLAAQTVAAQLTAIAQNATATPGSVPVNQTAEATGQPSVEPTNPFIPPTATMFPTNTLAPTATPLPTNTPLPTATQRPPATNTPVPTPVPCNAAQYVKDVTIPDNTVFAPGTGFTKTWRLKNVGSCTWTTGYSLVFLSGDEMDGDTVPLPRSVAPGDTIDLSVDLIAPSQPGTYTGNWMLRNRDGRFGIGSDQSKAFWVKIKVEQITSGIVYNFADNFCAADWESSSGELPCPGKGTEPSGFVIYDDEPDLEHRRENEPTIFTNPPTNKDSWITGTFPPIRIQDDDEFLADIGCAGDSEGCDVIFELNYRIDNGPLKSLGDWREVYDGNVTRIQVDLSELANRPVQFVLTVTSNGASKNDAAFWLMPQIRR